MPVLGYPTLAEPLRGRSVCPGPVCPGLLVSLGFPPHFPAPGASPSPVPVSGSRRASPRGNSSGGSGGPQRVWRGAPSPRPVPPGRARPCRPPRVSPAAPGPAGGLAGKRFRATFHCVAEPAAELTHVFLPHCANCYSQQPASSIEAYFEEQNKKPSPVPLIILYWSNFVDEVFLWVFFLACSLCVIFQCYDKNPSLVQT